MNHIQICKYVMNYFGLYIRKILKDKKVADINYGIFVQRIKWDILSAIRHIEGGRLKGHPEVFIGQDDYSDDGKVRNFDAEDGGVSVDNAKRGLIFEYLNEYIPTLKVKFRVRDRKILNMLYSVDEEGLFSGEKVDMYYIGSKYNISNSNVSKIIKTFVEWVKVKKGVLIERKMKGKEIFISRVNDKSDEADPAMLNSQGADKVNIDIIKKTLGDKKYELYRERFKVRLEEEHLFRLNKGEEGILNSEGQLKDGETVNEVISSDFYKRTNNIGSIYSAYKVIMDMRLKLKADEKLTVFIVYAFGFMTKDVWLESKNIKRNISDLTEDQRREAKRVFSHYFNLEDIKRRDLDGEGLFDDLGQIKNAYLFKEVTMHKNMISSIGINGVYKVGQWIRNLKLENKVRPMEFLSKLVYELGFVSKKVWQDYLDSKNVKSGMSQKNREIVHSFLEYYLENENNRIKDAGKGRNFK